MDASKIFVLGLSEFHARQIRPLAEKRGWQVFPVNLSAAYAQGSGDVAEHLFECAEASIGSPKMEDGERPDAIVAYRDFPDSTLLPILAKRYGVRGPDAAAVLRCQHQYWSRLIQASAIPDHVPVFQAFDPYDAESIHSISLKLPMWIKSVRSDGDGVAVFDPGEVGSKLLALRRKLGRVEDPFADFLRRVEVPEPVLAIGARACLAESLLTGRGATISGYVLNGEITTLGIVDIHREGRDRSITRCRYPSLIPETVQIQVAKLSGRVVAAVGLDNCCFHADFRYNESTGKLWLSDVRARIAADHALLFEAVDGTSTFEVALDVALGNLPYFERGRGMHAVAECHYLRRRENGVATNVPTEAELASIEATGHSSAEFFIREEQLLSAGCLHSDLGFHYATVTVAGETDPILTARFAAVVKALGLVLPGAVPHHADDWDEPLISPASGPSFFNGSGAVVSRSRLPH